MADLAKMQSWPCWNLKYYIEQVQRRDLRASMSVSPKYDVWYSHAENIISVLFAKSAHISKMPHPSDILR